MEELKGANGGYAWEDEYQRSWDIVKEDDGGSLEGIVTSLVEARKKRFMKNVTPFQRGIIRTMVLVVDLSSSMQEKDLRPNRASITISYAIDFVGEFFDQNPISQLGIVVMRSGVATLVSDVSGNPQSHIDNLRALRKLEPKGDPSLQNALEMSKGLLLHVASHCTREVLIIFGSLLTSDPGDIHKTILSLVVSKIRVRVIGLTAQVAICAEMVRKTNFGDSSLYGVILNETHYKELLMNAVTPLAISNQSLAETAPGFSLVEMGFPSRISETASPSFCSCHSKLTYGGYVCPQCLSKICSLPTVCPCCQLMLILSTHLARSYHHLFPLKTYVEVPVLTNYDTEFCFGCQIAFPAGVTPLEAQVLKAKEEAQWGMKKHMLTSSRYRCPDCQVSFCIDCDVFSHDVLHNCMGCESIRESPSKPTLSVNAI
ncbi:hypothetical protein BABINDRAFT_46317 [Babjeviella inositovora NRRL Y-12698]|uniref:General transcription and DNA repair factor IIH n=1 Tax=Babjeviella inositovora NRRL Y-12698 TaxID=984486 RepID=A0A1E3QYF5_9ASCO|nr:uncharacterized protein BABINDRAFT_46317 [Babjeviella inositovora NRRL Y-12698]ODQ82107.1 hypothetical protein BABINDRAFT_46317 [Babjeviella inositovora NRRL Y-12698]